MGVGPGKKTSSVLQVGITVAVEHAEVITV